MISVSFTDLMPNANILLAAYAGDKMGVVLGVIFLLYRSAIGSYAG